mmetsp:Transcript_9510/g.21833  ORF Transcript_9510/g.21833 Transcript_9510/m.21833 type:complete len:133 (+) Transcript_9510:780-1178(+)
MLRQRASRPELREADWDASADGIVFTELGLRAHVYNLALLWNFPREEVRPMRSYFHAATPGMLQFDSRWERGASCNIFQCKRRSNGIRPNATNKSASDGKEHQPNRLHCSFLAGFNSVPTVCHPGEWEVSNF